MLDPPRPSLCVPGVSAKEKGLSDGSYLGADGLLTVSNSFSSESGLFADLFERAYRTNRYEWHKKCRAEVERTLARISLKRVKTTSLCNLS